MSSLNTTALLIVAGVAAIALVIDYFAGYKADPREPPVVKPKIPYIGHIIGLVQHGNDYYRQLCVQHKMPIFTIPLLTGRAYVISDPDLALATQRSSKTISFSPFKLQLSKTFFQCDERQMEILADNLTGSEPEKNIINSVTKDMYATLAPGEDLDEMNQKLIDTLVPRLEAIKPGKIGLDIDLHAWTRQLITDVSTDAFYGKENPFKKQEVYDGFWQVEKDFVKLVLPGGQYIVPKASKGRADVLNGYEEYYRSGGHISDGSATTKARYHGHMSYPGVVFEDNARFELGIPIGLLANSVPSTFWYCLYAYSDPGLLAELRSELETALTTKTSNGITTRTLDLSRMRDSCPLFLSSFQEVLRTRSTTALNRTVIEDMTFADRYLLKKDGLVSMPTQVTHADTEIWGSDAAVFDPKRMIKRKLTKDTGDKPQRLHAAGFRAFGAAPWICPGRHFATAEILIFVAALVMQFDMIPLDKNGNQSGEWVFPKSGASILSSVLPPEGDIRVRIKLREGVREEDRLEIVISEGGGTFPLPN